jgi:hypothetical protein
MGEIDDFIRDTLSNTPKHKTAPKPKADGADEPTNEELAQDFHLLARAVGLLLCSITILQEELQNHPELRKKMDQAGLETVELLSNNALEQLEAASTIDVSIETLTPDAFIEHVKRYRNNRKLTVSPPDKSKEDNS